MNINEILQVAEAVSREKRIEREIVVEAMEQGIQKAARTKYGAENDIRAKIDRKTGAVSLARYREVVPEILIDAHHILLEDAKVIKADAEIGDFIIDELPPMEYGRVAAQTAKNVIAQHVREAIREREFEDFKDREGEIVNGVVKRVDYGNVVVELGTAEAIIRRNETIPRERFKNGDRVRAYIYAVRREAKGPQIFLSRTHPQFMVGLFRQEVPEIYDGIIEIRAVARDPGSRAKIAVTSRDSSIDPVGACVGVRGSRVQAVVGELQGERVDIINFTQDTATLAIQALQPAKIDKVVLDDENRRMDVVVDEEQLSLAIGRRGQNVRLASQLTGWDIDIMTAEEESEKRAEETKKRTELFMEALDVDDMIAHLLVSEGFVNVETVAYINLAELAEIPGFNADIATELQARAASWIETRDNALREIISNAGVSVELQNLEGITLPMLAALAQNDVKSLDDLGDLAADELVEIVGSDKLTEAKASDIIMKIRETWFEDEDAASEGQEEAA